MKSRTSTQYNIVNTHKLLISLTQPTFLPLTFRSLLETFILLLMKVSDRDRNVKGKNVGCVKQISNLCNNLPTEECFIVNTRKMGWLKIQYWTMTDEACVMLDCVALEEWYRVLHPTLVTGHKRYHFRDVLPSQSLGVLLKKQNLNRQKQTTHEQKGLSQHRRKHTKSWN